MDGIIRKNPLAEDLSDVGSWNQSLGSIREMLGDARVHDLGETLGGDITGEVRGRDNAQVVVWQCERGDIGEGDGNAHGQCSIGDALGLRIKANVGERGGDAHMG
ncbi:unnamed protein product, partial [Ilex paraguariensis]